MVSASDLRSEGREFEPCPVHERCNFRRNINSHSAPRSRNTPSRFILQKPEINAGLMGLLTRSFTIRADTLPLNSLS